jgi:hypothetical protein
MRRLEPGASISLREVTDADVEIFYDYQSDPISVEMAAFPAREKAAHLQPAFIGQQERGS